MLRWFAADLKSRCFVQPLTLIDIVVVTPCLLADDDHDHDDAPKDINRDNASTIT